MTSHLLTKDQASGAFSASRPPELTVTAGAGDTITFETDDLAYAQMEQFRDLRALAGLMGPEFFVRGIPEGTGGRSSPTRWIARCRR